MRLPEVAERIREIAWDLPDVQRDELYMLADEIRRRPAIRGKRVSREATDELREIIREYALSHPGMSQQAIAVKHCVNHGRVSEALKGFRS